MASPGTNTIAAARTAAVRRTDTATHWQLMWWKFRRHKMALLGGSILAFLVFFSLFAEFFAPYTPQERTVKYAQGRPMGFHLIDAQGSFHLRPFVYARVTKRDKVTLRLVPTVDTTTMSPIQFFVRGDEYNMWGLFESDIHFFGFEDKKVFLHLLGTDQLGRDYVLARSLCHSDILCRSAPLASCCRSYWGSPWAGLPVTSVAWWTI